MIASPVLLDSAAKIEAFEVDEADPASVFADRVRYAHYLPLLGNVSYAERDNYWREEYVPRR